MYALFDTFSNHFSLSLNLFWSKKAKKISISLFLILSCIIPLCNWFACSTSTSISNTITSDQFNFTGFSSTSAHNVVLGPVSNSLYYLYHISTPSTSVVRKLNPDSYLAWMAVVSFWPIQKSLTVDPSENYAYIASNTNPLDIVRFGSSTGSIVDSQR